MIDRSFAERTISIFTTIPLQKIYKILVAQRDQRISRVGVKGKIEDEDAGYKKEEFSSRSFRPPHLVVWQVGGCVSRWVADFQAVEKQGPVATRHTERRLATSRCRTFTTITVARRHNREAGSATARASKHSHCSSPHGCRGLPSSGQRTATAADEPVWWQRPVVHTVTEKGDAAAPHALPQEVLFVHDVYRTGTRSAPGTGMALWGSPSRRPQC